MGRSKELSRARAAHMEAALAKSIKSEPVNAVLGAKPKDKWKPKGRSPKVCGHCGGAMHNLNDCPAKGKRCAICSKPNHFAKACWFAKNEKPHTSKSMPAVPVRAVTDQLDQQKEQDDMDDDEGEYTVHSAFCTGETKSERPQPPKCQIQLEHSTVDAIIDTG